MILLCYFEFYTTNLLNPRPSDKFLNLEYPSVTYEINNNINELYDKTISTNSNSITSNALNF